ncbi:MAG: response regulator transcription factor [Chloroflexi bacterium]|nr:response regulator transcription factor [Chloroflexota bacterium]
MPPRRVGLVDDDDALRQLLARGLVEEGFDVVFTARRGGALLRADVTAMDIAILDIGLPDADGRDVLAALRTTGHDLPVMLLTARGELVDRLSGFVAGADDYLVKPFSFEELVLRLRSLSRRSATSPHTTVAAAVTRLDHARHSLCHAERVTRLTPTEFRLMALLLARRGDVVRRASLTAAGWPHCEMVHDNTLDSYVARLRRGLRTVGSTEIITTVHHVGYRLDG